MLIYFRSKHRLYESNLPRLVSDLSQQRAALSEVMGMVQQQKQSLNEETERVQKAIIDGCEQQFKGKDGGGEIEEETGMSQIMRGHLPGEVSCYRNPPTILNVTVKA